VVGVLAALPDGLDKNKLETIIVGLMALCVLGIILVLRTVQKVMWRVGLVVLLLGFGGSLWWQRDNLEHCRDACTCRLYWQDVRVPDIANLNPNCHRDQNTT
jgi:hypothetical protein